MYSKLEFAKLMKTIETNEQLHEVYDMIKFQQKIINSAVKNSLATGDKVYFDSKKGRIEGTLVKKNRNTVKVMSTTGVLWTVTPSLVKKIS